MTETHLARAVDVTVTEVIRRPLEIVSRYAGDPTNAPEWYAKISAVEWKTSPPVGVNSEVAFVARFLGRELRYTYQIVEYTPTTLVMRTAEGPFPMETSYRFEQVADGTHMTIRNRGNPSGFSRLVAPFMASAMRRAMRKDLIALKGRLEA